MLSGLLVFSFLCVLSVKSKNSLPRHRSWGFFLIFFFLEVLYFYILLLNQWCILNWFPSKIWDLDFWFISFICGCPFAPLPFGAETLSPIELLFTFIKKQLDLTLCGLFWVPCSVLLIFFQYHTVCITITVYSVLKSGRLIHFFSNFF